jgi:hypothetical protein
MNLQEQLDNFKPNYTGLTEKNIQDAIEHVRSKQQEPTTINIFKISCNQKMLNQLRETGIPEEYLKLAVINYKELQ